MRLSKRDCNVIVHAAFETFSPGTSVSLFGSRTDDARRGGDIDLLVETQEEIAVEQWVVQRSSFVTRIWRHLGERKIDIVLATQNKPDTRSLVIQARQVAILLEEQQ